MPSHKHVHFIGVAGVTMAPLAVLYKSKGWRVTGSDRAFFPPMSTYLEENDIEIMPGFKKEHVYPKPDLVIVMAFITEKNPELMYARERGIPYKTYSEVLPELIEKKNSVVVAGSRGKTTITAFIVWMLERAGYRPSFMVGGIPKNFAHGIRSTDSEWSVLEGDEYATASWDPHSKFLDYNPSHLILTGATWDHMNIFPTEEAYKNAYIQLVAHMPPHGVIIAERGGKNLEEIVRGARGRVVWYDPKEPDFFLPPARTLAKEIDVANYAVEEAYKTFAGIGRRQEVRYQNARTVVIDDNAHSPEKVSGVLAIVRMRYPQKKIIAVYEPGSRTAEALAQEQYKVCFREAAHVFLPRVSTAVAENREFNKKLAHRYAIYYPHMEYADSDADLVKKIEKITAGDDTLVLFMSQKGFRGMIEDVISRLQSSQK